MIIVYRPSFCTACFKSCIVVHKLKEEMGMQPGSSSTDKHATINLQPD
jgi:hypothetical protein